MRLELPWISPRAFSRVSAALLVTAAAWACSSEDESTSSLSEPKQITHPLKNWRDWAEGAFEQVLRVIPDGAAELDDQQVRNVCELTVMLGAYKPLTFTAGTGNQAISVGWMDAAVSNGGLSVEACSGSYPCELKAKFRGAVRNGVEAGCDLRADDAQSALVGTTSGSALKVADILSDRAVFTQQVKLSRSVTSIAGRCVFWMKGVHTGAEMRDLSVSVNGAQQLSMTGPLAIGGVTYPQKSNVSFGTIIYGDAANKTLLKHVQAQKTQVGKGDTVQCAGAYDSSAGVSAFDVNLSTTPTGTGMTINVEPTGWTCDPALFGSGGACDCFCGILDPDCAGNECPCDAAPCDPDAICTNVAPNTYSCDCPAGMVGDGTDCQCDLNGTFAEYTETEVAWDQGLIFQAGTETLRSWSIRTQSVNGSTVTVERKLCGGTAPDLCNPGTLFGPAAFGQDIPYCVFDGTCLGAGAPGIPLVDFSMGVSDASPGQPFIGTDEIAIYGLALGPLDGGVYPDGGTYPVNDWPANWDDPLVQWQDHDGDGPLGVTAYAKTGFSESCQLDYDYLPNPSIAGPRIAATFLGSRVVSNLNGSITSCDTMSGLVEGPDANNLPQAHGHVRGCRFTDDSTCSAAQTDTLDSQVQSTTQRATAARFRMVRVADDITCPEVRAMSFP